MSVHQHTDNAVKLAMLSRFNITTQVDGHRIGVRKHSEEADKNRHRTVLTVIPNSF